MGNVCPPEKVKLIAGLISNDIELLDKIKHVLEKRFANTVDFESGVLDFTHTEYYNEEMGLSLKRKFFSFNKPVSLESIEKFKLLSNKIEKKNSVGAKRKINIDPGYLDLSKLVLFSTKDYSHRVHIGKGIFAEVTLFYKDKKFNAWPWTYPDYRTDSYLSIFDNIRELYKKDLGR